MVKVGDKVLCIKSRNLYYTVGKYYIIENIREEHEAVVINGYEFHIGKYTKGYYNFCDYFDTELSIRKKKLNKLNSL